MDVRATGGSSATARRVGRFIATVVLVPILVGATAAIFLATTPWGNERVRRIVVSQANDRITGSLSVGALQGNLFSSAVLTGVVLLDSAGRPVFTARRVALEYSLWAALHRQLVMRSIALDTALVVLDKRPGLLWNFQSIMRPSAPKDTSQHSPTPELSNITIRHSRFFYRRPWVPDSTLAAPARDSSIAAAVDPSARQRIERVPGGFQRVLDYHDLDAVLPSVRIAHGSEPTAVRIASLSMLAEPYRPPAIDVRSLTGTLLVSKDSLWWRGVHLRLPASNVSGDGTIGFHKSGFRLDLSGSPIAVADLRWLDPALPSDGEGRLRYAMHLHGDTADFDVTDATLQYRHASLTGHASVSRIAHAVVHGAKATLLVRDADLTVSGLTTSIIHELAPKLVLRREGTIDGHAAVSGELQALQLDADVRFTDLVAGVSHVMARGGVGNDAGLRAQDLRLTLQPLQVRSLAGTGARFPVAGVLVGTATVDGDMLRGWTVRGDLTHEDAGRRSRVVGSGRYVAASTRVDVAADLEPLSLATVGRFAPSAELEGAVAGDVHVDGTLKDIRFRASLRSLVDGGAFTARGSVSPNGASTGYDLAATLDSVDGRHFSRRVPEMRVTGTVVARGRGFDPATLTSSIDAHLARSSYDTFVVDRLVTRLAAANGILHVDTLDVIGEGVRGAGGGTLGLTAQRSGTLRFAAAVDSLGALRARIGSTDTGLVAAPAILLRDRLVTARADSMRRADSIRIERIALGLPEGVPLRLDSLPPLRRDSLAGRVLATGTLAGNIMALEMMARVHANDLVAHGSRVGGLEATLSSPNIRDSLLDIRFNVAADSIQAAGYAFEHADADGRYRQTALTLDLRVRQDARVAYVLSGDVARPAAGVYDGRLASLRAAFDTVVWQSMRPAAIRIDHGAVSIDSLLLRGSSGGLIFANGVVPRANPAHLDVTLEGLRIATVLQVMQRDATADGVVGLHAHLDGIRSDPVIAGSATLRSVAYGGIRAPDADASVRYRAHSLQLDAAARDSSGRQVLAGTALLPLDLALDSVAGSRRLPGPVVADVTLDSLALASLPLPMRELESVLGMVVADAHVRGTWSAPSYSGAAALRGGAFTLTLTGMHVQDAVMDLRIAGDSLHLDSLVARAGGALRAWGSVDLHDMSRPFVNMSASGQNVRAMDQNRGLVDADADIQAIGPLDALRVTGRGEMRDGFLALHQFRKDLLRVKAPGDLNFLAVFDTSAPPNDSVRLRMARQQKKRVAIIADLSLVVDRGNYYRNRPDANTEFYTGDGEELRIHVDQRTDDQFAIGFVRIGGGYAFFRTRPFTPAQGSLTFGPHTNAAGIVQQVGERLLWEPGQGWFPLQLLTGGTSKGPAIGLEAGRLFPLRGRELNSYLTLGRSSTSLLQQTGSSLSGSESWSGQLSGESGALAHRQQAATALGVVLHDLGTGATKQYGLDALSVAPADVPIELVFGKTGGVRGALVEGGRFLTTERYLAGELRLTTGIPGVRFAQNFGTTYRLDAGIEPRFVFHAPEELGITHPTVRTGVFGMFLTRFWDF